MFLVEAFAPGSLTPQIWACLLQGPAKQLQNLWTVTKPGFEIRCSPCVVLPAGEMDRLASGR